MLVACLFLECCGVSLTVGKITSEVNLQSDHNYPLFPTKSIFWIVPLAFYPSLVVIFQQFPIYSSIEGTLNLIVDDDTVGVNSGLGCKALSIFTRGLKRIIP